MNFKFLIVLFVSVVLSGCATTSNDVVKYDKLEPMNRKIFAFNEAVDGAITKPLAESYKKHTPVPVKSGINNFFNNLSDVGYMFNNLLQGDFKDSFNGFARVITNSSLGIFGLIDVAGHAGVEQVPADFGETLGKWGVESGQYVVLPLWGPSSVRDSVGVWVDFQIDPVLEFNPNSIKNSAFLVRAIEKRSDLLAATDLLDAMAIDKYSQMRDAYLQHREVKIKGKSTMFDEDVFEDDEDLPNNNGESAVIEETKEVETEK